MYRLAIEIAPVILVSEDTFSTLEDAVKAQIKNDNRNVFTIIQKKEEDGQWKRISNHEVLGLKIKLRG